MKLTKGSQNRNEGGKKRKKERKNDFISLLSVYIETNLLSNNITVLFHRKRHRKIKGKGERKGNKRTELAIARLAYRGRLFDEREF